MTIFARFWRDTSSPEPAGSTEGPDLERPESRQSSASSLPSPLRNLLTEAGSREPSLAGIDRVVERVGSALARFDAVDLEPFELDDGSTGTAVWPKLETRVREALDSTRQAAEDALARFRRDPTFTSDLHDLDLAHALEGEGGASAAPIRDRYDARIEVLLDEVRPGRAETLPSALAGLAALMAGFCREHDERLARPELLADRAALLGDLHELVSKLTRTLEAFLGACAGGLQEGPAAQIVPRFEPPGRVAARLRTWALELEAGFSALPVPDSLESLAALRKDVARLLTRATNGREPRWLRPADRAELQAYRRWWLRSAASTDLETARHQHAAFARWLAAMRGINNRRVLERHDHRVLHQLVELLDRQVRGRALVELLDQVRGRDEALDRALVTARRGEPPDPAQLYLNVKRVLEKRTRRTGSSPL